MSSAALQVVNLQARYEQTQVLRGVSLHAMPGEAIVLLGRNGSGRRTMLQAISGNTTDTCSGSIRIIGRESLHEVSPDISHLGLYRQPLESHVIPDFTCEENLLMPPAPQHDFGGGLSLTRIYELCPVLQQHQHKPASELAPGTRRLLALARLLRTGANLILINEFASTLCASSLEAFIALINRLKQLDYTLVLAESRVDVCTRFASRYYVLDGGNIVDGFPASALSGRRAWLDGFLQPAHTQASGSAAVSATAGNGQSAAVSFWAPPRPR